MSGDVPLYDLAGNGLAEITAPVSNRMSVVTCDKHPSSSHGAAGSFRKTVRS